MSKKSRNRSQRKNKKKNKKYGSYYYSWHFWFFHTIVVLTVIPVYLVSEGQLFKAFIVGLFAYLSPVFLYYVRGIGTPEILNKFYFKTIRRPPKKKK